MGMGADMLIVEASHKELKYLLDLYKVSKEILRLNQSYIIRITEVGETLFHAELIDPVNGAPTFGHIHMPISSVGELLCLAKDNARARLDKLARGGPLPDGYSIRPNEEPGSQSGM